MLKGAAEVSKDSGEERVHLATLRPPEICGEMSLIHETPTNASVSAVHQLETLFLSRTEFHELTKRYPQVLEYLKGVSDERGRHNRALMESHTLLDDDEHVLI